MGLPDGSGDKKSAFNAGDLASTPGLGRCPGEGNSYPLQYSSLENSMDCTVHGVTKSWTLSDFYFHFRPQLKMTGIWDKNHDQIPEGLKHQHDMITLFVLSIS